MGRMPAVRTEALEKRMTAFLRERSLLPAGARVLLACSGGVDSVALVHLFHRLAPERRWHLEVAHYDHHSRPSSREDALFVRGVAEQLGLPFILGKAQKPPAGRESAWRRLRYQFLAESARERQLEWVATGHTLDDQAETVLLKGCRFASGSKSFSGMKVSRDLEEGGPTLVRPLLCLKRRALEGYLDKIGVESREDETNRDLRFLRNRIRHRVLPCIERWVDPKASDHLARSALLLSDEDAFLDEACVKQTRRLVTGFSRGFRLDTEGFRSLHVALQRRLLRMVLEVEVKTDLLEQVRTWLLSDQVNLSWELPKGRLACKEGNKALFWKKRQGIALKELVVPGQVVWGHWRIKAEYEDPETALTCARGDLLSAALDADRLELPLRVRPWAPGDRFMPLGLDGTQKLHDFFINQKVPRLRRSTLPLVVSGTDVVWVVGHRIDDQFRIKDSTQRAVKMTAEERIDKEDETR